MATVFLKWHENRLILSWSNTGNYVVKRCSQKFYLHKWFITLLNAFVHIWAPAHAIACLSWKACNKHVFRWGTHLYMSFFLPVHSSICCAPYLRKHTSCDHNFWYTCVKWWNIQVFFHFYKILIFRIFRGKREKMDQTDKKLCLSCLISQGPYIIWSSFMVHMCKMIISPGIFHFF